MIIGLTKSFFFMVSFFLFWGSIMLYPKTERKLGFIQETVMNFLVVLCIGAIGAGGLSFVNIPVDLFSMGLLFLLPSIVILFLIIRKKSVQKFSISKLEMISLFLLTIVFVLVELKTFSLEMRAAYNYNTDAGNHLFDALAIFRRKKVGGMYFAHLYNGLTIELFQPVLEEIKYYKGFVFADCFHYYFELVFAYAVIYSVAKKKHTKYMAPVLTLLLWAGYPLYCFIEGHYVYWGWGAILLCLIIYTMEQYIVYKENLTGCTIKVLLGFSGVVLCYSLFAPLAVVAVGIVILAEIKKGNIKLNRRLVIGMLTVCIIGIGIAAYVYYSYFYVWNQNPFSSLKIPGGCYMNLFTDFLWMLPILLVFFYCCYKKQIKLQVYGIVYLSFVGVQLILLIAFFAEQLSAYYYYKFYYPLWFLSWIVTARAIDTIPVEKSERKFLYSYAILVGVVYISCFGRLPERLNDTGAGWLSSETNVGTELYSQNVAYLARDYEDLKYSSAQLELCKFSIENLRDKGEYAVFAGGKDCMGAAYWYRGITDMGNITRQLVEATGDTWKDILDSGEWKYYVVLKTSELYKENMEYFEGKNWIFENEEGFIVQVD